MRTLEEVVKDAARWREYEPGSLERDAMYYLQDYLVKRERVLTQAAAADEAEKRVQMEINRYQEAVKNCEEAENKYRLLAQNSGELSNDPLTWDELKGMGEKPVWVEIISRILPIDSSWGIATGGPYLSWEGVERWTLVRPGVEYSLPVGDYGKTWQAYRKELIRD